MADHTVDSLGGKTLLQYADTPYMDMLAKKGRCGRLITVPDGYQPGSEVANTAILGYDLDKVYEGRGPLEAASIGYEMRPDDMAIRCNIITLADGKIKNHHGGHLTTEDGTELINYLNEHLGNERVQFIPGIQYRHLLVIRGGNKHILCSPPHDHPDEEWNPLLVKGEEDTTGDIKAEYLDFGDSADSLKDGKIDAAFIVAGAPTPAVQDLGTGKQIYLVSLDKEHIDSLIASSPYYKEYTISKDVYGTPEDVTTVAVAAVVIARNDVTEAAIYNFVSAVFDNIDEIGHAKKSELSIDFASSISNVPYHPGAAKYFAEKDITVNTAA